MKYALRAIMALWFLGAASSNVLLAQPADAFRQADTFDAVPDREAGDISTVPLRSALRPSLLQRKRQEAGPTDQQKAWIKDNCQFGMPITKDGVDLGAVRIIAREGYVLGHSSLSKIPYWVCEHSEKRELEGPADRDGSSFKPDPELQGFPRAELSDYAGSTYDRGHMAPAGDFKSSQSLMNQSFFLSNMVPQYGPTFNRGIWAELEGTTRQWVKKRGECWIISGPMFYDPLEDDPSTADGWVPYNTVGQNEVAVPTHTYKIVLAKNADDKWEAISFVFDNKQHAQPYRLHVHRTTVRWIEDRTGLNFFSQMEDDPNLAAVNATMESQKSQMWDIE